MPGFDPKAFIAENSPPPRAEGGKAFDPKKFISEVEPVAAKAKADPGVADAAMRGVAGGLLSNFADEAVGGAGGLYDYVQGKLGNRGDISLSDAYHTRRDSARQADAEAKAAHPGVTMGGEILGGLGSIILPAAVLKGARAVGVIGKGAEAAVAAGEVTPEVIKALTTAEKMGKVAAGTVKSVLAGAGYGAVAGAGDAKEFTDIPDDALRGAGIGAATAGVLHGATGAAGYVAKKALPLAANVFGGVNESTLGKYISGRERINAVGELERQSEHAVSDAVDTGVAQAVGDKTVAAERAAALDEGLNDAYKNKIFELKGKATPLTKAKEMTAAIQAQKTQLGTLSAEADAALDGSGVTFQKQHLLQSIDRIGKAAGDGIGDETHAALQKLQILRDRVDSQLPDVIDAPRLRTVLQQIRKDTNFDLSAGEFNDSLNGMRKEFTSQISGALKEAVPEYATYMQRMEGLAKNVGKMDKYFGDESKALGSLEVLRRGGAKSQIIEDALQNHALISGDATLAKHLADVKDNHALLDRINAGEDLRPEFFPKEHAALREAQADAHMAAQVAEPVLGLTPKTTQSIVRNQGGTVPSKYNRRALEELGNIDGVNHLQNIEDKNVYDALAKEQGRTGRNAVMMSAIGGGVGGLIGGVHGAAAGISAGGALGGILDRYGPKIVKGTVDSAYALRDLLASTDGVKALGPYAKELGEAAAKGNGTLAAVNQALLKNDPFYGIMFKKSADEHQKKRDAIKRRLGE